MAQVNAGRVRFVSRGEYNNSTQYYSFDLVNYNGNSYFAKVNTKSNIPTNTTYWQLIAEKGNPGNIGPKGETGNGIASIVKTASAGLIDTYMITYTNGSTSTFYITNGKDGDVTQEYVDEESERLRSLYNVLPKVSGSGESVELENTGDTMLYKVGLSGNTSQEVVSGEVGLEVEDTSVYVDDVDESKENYITLKGNSYQESTSGKNIFDYLELDTAMNNKGLSGVLNDDGSITLSGIPTTNYAGITISKDITDVLEDGQTYCLSQTKGSTLFYVQVTRTAISDGRNTYISLDNDSTNSTTFIVEKSLYTYSIKAQIGVIANWGTENRTVTQKFQLEKGSVVTDFEPYTGGQASPNPDYPQEVEVVSGYNEVVIEGDNLFNKNNKIEYEKFYTNTGDIGTDTETFIQTLYIPVKSNITYTISGYYNDYFRICEYDNKKNFIKRSISDNNTTSFSITTTNSTKYIRVSCYIRNIDSLKLELGETATPYEEYKGASYEVNLGKNLFNIKNSNGTNNSVSYSVNEDVLTLNGTLSSDRIEIELPKPLYFNGTYTFSKDYNSTIALKDSSNNNVFIINGSLTNTTDTVNNTISKIVIYQSSGTVFNNTEIRLQIEKGDKATPYSPYFEPIELCKIGDYQDKIYKSLIDGEWYVHKEIGKVVLDGSNVKFTYQEQDTYPNSLMIPSSSRPRGLGNVSSVMCSHFSNISSNVGSTLNTLYWGASTQMWLCKEDFTSLEKGNNWLSNNNIEVYYVLETPTETQITNETLASQLNALYNAKIHSTTHINTETSNLLPYIDLKYNVITASPSPERASEVEVVTGDNKVIIGNRNLFDGKLELGNFSNETGEKLSNTQYIINSKPIPVEELTNYKISSNGAGIRMYVFEYKEDLSYNLTSRKSVDADSHLTTNKGTKYINFRTIDANTNLQEKIQVEYGETATPYTPHKSQSYHVTLGDLELCKIGDYQDTIRKSTGKNLFDKDKTPDNYYYNANGTTTIDNVNKFINQEIPFSKTYSISFANAIINTQGNNPNVRLIEFNGNNFIKRTLITTKTSVTLDNSTNKVIISVDAGPNAYFEDLQIEKGTQATEYEPFGKVWCKRSMIGKAILNGNEKDWGIFANTTKGITNFYNNSIIKFKEQKGYSNNMQVVGENGAYDYVEYPKLVMFNSLVGIGVYFKTSEISNVDDFKTWLSNNNTIVYYPLATPTSTKITDQLLISQLDELKNAMSYYDKTLITQENDSKPFILDVVGIRDLQDLFNTINQ